ncbi:MULTISPECIES: hypothetical protein [unclassified Streptomyces]|uniref:hypothetical protein n=1 Tax=unclassified Streptomyces TaxID=2593676 RepID=UPI002DD7A93A|nr:MULTISPECIES: hypothetical protein [unclassified Streptomyces]WSA91736.1 hypothetical protein OIE63_09320 [Streptomyces sp. NBC_01795]WSB76106.1 hypothetical protein OHB04_10120 [Streptomyces sp. NBC_01775]WSS15620.1 hypothetical protein OG533_29805 [Streptomyces sp. NBC_01186]WSS44461.1 hypothetical protein OG220_30605 [Streptomyces sp. NBC_01187]
MPPASRPPLDEVGDFRRGVAALADGALTVWCGLAVAQLVAADAKVGPWWGTVAIAALGASFVNHVLLSLLIRGSVAKFLTGLRVVRDPDDDRMPVGGFRRPGFWRTVGRWADGLLYLVKQPFLALVGGEWEVAEDKLGILLIRRRELVAAGR